MEENNAKYFLVIVAIVAIVAIVSLFMLSGNKVGTVVVDESVAEDNIESVDLAGQAIALNTKGCSDKDGEDFFTKSDVRSKKYPKGKYDYCQKNTKDGKTYLVEGICKNGEYNRISKYCPDLGNDYYCDDGKCVKDAEDPTCITECTNQYGTKGQCGGTVGYPEGMEGLISPQIKEGLPIGSGYCDIKDGSPLMCVCDYPSCNQDSDCNSMDPCINGKCAPLNCAHACSQSYGYSDGGECGAESGTDVGSHYCGLTFKQCMCKGVKTPPSPEITTSSGGSGGSSGGGKKSSP